MARSVRAQIRDLLRRANEIVDPTADRLVTDPLDPAAVDAAVRAALDKTGKHFAA